MIEKRRAPSPRYTLSIMVDASILEGYLMKEKSKMSLLHGLTGDINKRYFRVRTIEVNKYMIKCSEKTWLCNEAVLYLQ